MITMMRQIFAGNIKVQNFLSMSSFHLANFINLFQSAAYENISTTRVIYYKRNHKVMLKYIYIYI